MKRVMCIKCNHWYSVNGISEEDAKSYECLECCDLVEYSLRRAAQLEANFQELNQVNDILEKADAFAFTRDNPHNWISGRCVYTNEFDSLDILIRLNERSGTFHTRQIENGELKAMEIW